MVTYAQSLSEVSKHRVIIEAGELVFIGVPVQPLIDRTKSKESEILLVSFKVKRHRKKSLNVMFRTARHFKKGSGELKLCFDGR